MTETLASNDLPTFLIYDTINATQALQNNYPTSSNASILLNNADLEAGKVTLLCAPPTNTILAGSTATATAQTAVQSRRKKRRRARTCKNKEDAESQRMTHIAVERNRRRQMNEYLAVLRSLMPDSYIQRVFTISSFIFHILSSDDKYVSLYVQLCIYFLFS